MSSQGIRSLHTVLCERLGCAYPIVQSPMTMVPGTELAAAASEAGAFGVFVSSMARPGEVERAILRIKGATAQPFGVYVNGMQPNVDEVLGVMLEQQVRALWYGRGFDKATISRLKSAGIVCMATAATARQAMKAADLGADIVVVQGGEGGGHTGPIASTILLPQVLDAVSVPVVAAGGFYDGRGLAAALAYGAAGVAMGTRFLMAAESPVAADTLARYRSATDPAKIRISTAVDGQSLRVIENDLIKRLEARSFFRRVMVGMRSAWGWKNAEKISYAGMLSLAFKAAFDNGGSFMKTVQAANLPGFMRKGLKEGEVDAGLLPAGQVAALINDRLTCREIVLEIARVAAERLSRPGVAS